MTDEQMADFQGYVGRLQDHVDHIRFGMFADRAQERTNLEEIVSDLRDFCFDLCGGYAK